MLRNQVSLKSTNN